jgi:hypothetical protein
MVLRKIYEAKKLVMNSESKFPENCIVLTYHVKNSLTYKSMNPKEGN